MHAIQIHAHGGPEVLSLRDASEPEPGPGEAVVEVAAAGVNYIDTYHRSGLYPMQLPFTPGLEGAGTVRSVGEGVSADLIGATVAWAGQIGSYAERAIVDTSRAVVVPDGVSSEQAAAVMLQGLTAHYLSSDTYRLDAGDRCLVHAGAGGVGLLLIQMAKMRGAEVFTTVSSPEKEQLARQAGADHVVGYEDFVDDVETAVGSRPLDVVYDGVGAATFFAGLQLLRPRGLMVLFGQASGPVPPIDLQILNRGGSLYVTRPTMGDYVGEPAELQRRAADLFQWIASGALTLTIGRAWPLAEAEQAHRALENRSTVGKTLLIP